MLLQIHPKASLEFHLVLTLPKNRPFLYWMIGLGSSGFSSEGYAPLGGLTLSSIIYNKHIAVEATKLGTYIRAIAGISPGCLLLLLFGLFDHRLLNCLACGCIVNLMGL